MTQPGAAPAPSPGAAPSPKPRRRRWMLRIVLALVLLILLATAAVQIILQTDLPRRIVLARLQTDLGLRIQAASLSTGWLGRTTLRDVTVALPLADDPFLQAPTLNVRHASLPALLIGRPLDISDIQVLRPRLVVQKTHRGEWNVQQALNLATRAAEARAAARSSSPTLSRPLPRLSIAEAAVTIIDGDKTATLAPLSLRGHPPDPLTWSFDAQLPPHARLHGRVAPGQGWYHHVTFSVDNPRPLLDPWLADWTRPIHLRGDWRGQIAGSTLVGQLDIHDAQVHTVALAGTLDLQASLDQATLIPRALLATVSGAAPVPIRLAGGSIQIRESRAVADDLRLHLLGGVARLQGSFDWPAQSARLQADWIDLALPADIHHRGRLTASLQTPLPNRPQIDVDLHTLGATPTGHWDARLAINGQGRSWSAFDWRLSLPQANWTGQPSDIALQDIMAHLTSDKDVLRLIELRWRDSDRLSGVGQFRFDRRDWTIALKARAVPLPRLSPAADIALNASGDRRQITIPELRLQTPSLTVEASAFYGFDKSRPFNADIRLWQSPAAPDEPRLLAGSVLRGDVHLTGAIYPLRADIIAQLFGRDLYVGKRPLGDLTLELAGKIDPAGAVLESREIDLLDGHWTVHGRYRFADGSAGLAVIVRDLALQQADAFLNPPPNITGSLGAEIRVDLPAGDRHRLNLTGDWQIADFRKGALRAERILGRVALDGPVLVLDDIQLNQARGSGSAEIRYDFRQRHQLAVAADLANWPIERPDQHLAASLSADTTLNIDLAQKSATGPLQINADVQLRNRDFARLRLTSTFQGRQLDVPRINADLLDGSVEGQAHLVLDDLLKSTAKLNWRDIDALALAELVPAMQGFQGRLSGSLEAAKPLDPRTTEPLRVQINLQSADAAYKAIAVGPASAVLLIDRTGQQPSPLPNRIIVDRSVFQLAGGQVNLWARATTHLGAPLDFVLTQIEFDNLDLDQLVHAAEPQAEPMVGRLAGQITLFGPRRDLKLLRGDAVVRLTRSDLANSDVIAAFYRTFSLQRGQLQPSGSGVARLRLEDGLLQIPSLRYQTRGLDMHASGQVQNMFLGPDSPIAGYAVGSARPLRDIKLPFLAELDDALGAIQSNVTTFRIDGTIHEPRVRPAAFSEINDALRRFLLDEMGLGVR